MKKLKKISFCFLPLLLANVAQTQTTPNAPEFIVDTAGMPIDVAQGYGLFRAKCGQCHSRNRVLTKTDLSPDEWADIVFRMQDMASSHLSSAQSKTILNFVIWNDQRSKTKGK